MTDHEQGAVVMTDYLIAQGHRRIAILYGHLENTSIDLRFEGVRESVESKNIELPRDWMIHAPYEAVAERGEAIVRRLLADGVTCLFCFENAIALEIYKVARTLKMTIPGEFSLCSFDDHSFVGEYQCFLTCVRQQLESIGFFGVDMVLKNLESTMQSPVHMLLEPELVVRRSVAAV